MRWFKFDYLDMIWCTEYVGAGRYEIVWNLDTDRYPSVKFGNHVGSYQVSRHLPKNWIFV